MNFLKVNSSPISDITSLINIRLELIIDSRVYLVCSVWQLRERCIWRRKQNNKICTSEPSSPRYVFHTDTNAIRLTAVWLCYNFLTSSNSVSLHNALLLPSCLNIILTKLQYYLWIEGIKVKSVLSDLLSCSRISCDIYVWSHDLARVTFSNASIGRD